MAGKKKKQHHEEHVDERWLLTYSDMITLLMALFIVMWSMATVNTSKFEALSASLKDAFSGKILPGGEAIMQPGSSSDAEQAPPEDPLPAIKAQEKTDAASKSATKEDEELKKLKKEIDSWTQTHGLKQQVETQIARRGLIVRVLTDDVLFDSGSATIKPSADGLLDALSKLLKTQVRNPIQVEGNTDNIPVTGQYPSNWELSTARATEVTRNLIRRGVWAGRLGATGYAAEHPIASNRTEAGRKRNRRVEIVVLRKYAGQGQAGTGSQGGTK
ncbi:MAG TPA: flagellar motor protein MotB [Solirubrobacteraceae bacterium]|nr:flagellar motor protein MotB [Solirubrobacteraceae bacterium]